MGQLGPQLWGFEPNGELESLWYWSGNVVPVNATPAAIDAFAARAREVGRSCSSIVGEADAVMRLWSALQVTWDRPRDVRPVQPLLMATEPPRVPGEPA